MREHAKEAYGTNYAETYPKVKRLLEEIDRIFDARIKRTARRRYEKVLAQRETFVALRPDATAIFDFLERHWPYLVNAIESHIVPTTNNATEQVIRIFTQHYYGCYLSARSVASKTSSLPGSTSASSKKSTASPPSPTMLRSASGASARWN